jgi:predicted metal-dependent hydrolase
MGGSTDRERCLFGSTLRRTCLWEIFHPMTRPVSVGFGELTLEDGPLRFELRRSSRRSIGITVQLGGAVVVTAPYRASMRKIHTVLRKHGRWVRGKVKELREAPSPPPPPKWIDGERHRFLGREYSLRLLEGENRIVWLTDHELLVHIPNSGKTDAVRKLVERWMRDEGRALFGNRMDTLIRATPALELRERPSLDLRRMKSRWGSCSPKGRILMNTLAIRLPLPLVDYILMHELCHLKVPNHSREFWEHLGECMPDWERRKEALDREVV